MRQRRTLDDNSERPTLSSSDDAVGGDNDGGGTSPVKADRRWWGIELFVPKKSSISYQLVPVEPDDDSKPVGVTSESPIAPTDGCFRESDVHERIAETGLRQKGGIGLSTSLLYLIVTFGCSVPTLLTSIWVIYDVTGRIWTTWIFCFHLVIVMWTAPSTAVTGMEENNPLHRNVWIHRCVRCLNILDMMLFGFVYPLLWTIILTFLLTEPDGTVVVEWVTLYQYLQFLRVGSIVTFAFRCVIAVKDSSNDSPKTTTESHVVRRTSPASRAPECQICLRHTFDVGLLLVGLLCTWCTYSLVVHLGPWPAPGIDNVTYDCDPLDTTECILPFPSFHHMRRDNTTATGWRVNLQSKQLPPLRGVRYLDPTFLNRLDGFSTMAPLMFYMQGLKQAQEHGPSSVRLQGPNNIAKSITNQSITLLLDVASHTLVPHSAEIDYLDPSRPLVLVFPAAPLRHNAHYALAVTCATDEHGNRLPPTKGMQSIMSPSDEYDEDLSDTWLRYRDVVLPSLETAAPWFSFTVDSSALQLLFDFQTVSAKSQLGPIRAVRDATLRYIQQSWNKNWTEHVHVTRQIDYDCGTNRTWVARTIHASLDVPWFLDGLGRHAVLDQEAMASGNPATIGQAKFVVHVPCSLRATALKEPGGQHLAAVMEYGHSLFYSRAEASDHYLVKMAHENGYIITCMDWRGMSIFDLPMVIQMLLFKPHLFEALRDNLIQAYASKLALQHFSRHGLLSMNWLSFTSNKSVTSNPIPVASRGEQPVFVFYGISLGGILGAGYLALAGSTGLIARGILNGGGAPFALIMTRSLDFVIFDFLLLLEASGALASPITEPFPPVLIQAGLGDPVVPTMAAESMARAFHAVVLTNNPIQPFGISVSSSPFGTPTAVLTELLYETEYQKFPSNNVQTRGNDVHFGSTGFGKMIACPKTSK